MSINFSLNNQIDPSLGISLEETDLGNSSKQQELGLFQSDKKESFNKILNDIQRASLESPQEVEAESPELNSLSQNKERMKMSINPFSRFSKKNQLPNQELNSLDLKDGFFKSNLLNGENLFQLEENVGTAKSDDISLNISSQNSNENMNSNLQTGIKSEGMDILNISEIDIQNKEEIINRISKYVDRLNLKKLDNLDFSVRHKDLGDFNINVQK